MINTTNKKVAIVGSGPAALMAASVLKNECEVFVFEKKRSPATKLLVAGKSGLNVSHHSSSLWKNYEGPVDHFKEIFKYFSVSDWLEFIHSLHIETFEGSTRRYFVKGLKAGPLLKNWMEKLKEKPSVVFNYNCELTDFYSEKKQVFLTFNFEKKSNFDAVCFCLGGASWEKKETPLNWPEIFKNKKILFEDFSSSNAGFEVDWSEDFLKEAEGLALKNVELTSDKGKQKGELTITNYGLEGTLVYSLDKPQKITINLKPDLSVKQIKEKISKGPENLSPIRRIKKFLNLSSSALALLYHHAPLKPDASLNEWAKCITHFPIELLKQRPLQEAISSKGGVKFEALTSDLELKDFPGIFLAGEMLDWKAPTGGYLIQACVSQGYFIAQKAINYLKKNDD